MRQLIKILLSLTVMCSLTSCSENDGDTGALFGVWSLRELKEDGLIDPEYAPDSTFFSFQNSIIQATRLLPHNDTELRTGTWSIRQGMLVLDFNHGDGSAPSSVHEYAPPEWIYITEPVTEMEIVLTHEKMILYHGRYTYTFVKVL